MSQPLQADQASLIFQTIFLHALQNEHATTRKIIEAIPLNKGDYRPEPIAKSALELAWHIVAAEKRFFEGIVAGEFNFAPISRPDSVRNSADIAAWYGEMFQAVFSRLQSASGEQLARTIDFRGVMQLPAVAFLRLALSHSIHHRGQLSTYLRPMGGKVPSIYGESYDAAEARKSAEAKTA